MKHPKLTNGQHCLRQLRGALRSLRYASQFETTNNNERMRWQHTEWTVREALRMAVERVAVEREGRS